MNIVIDNSIHHGINNDITQSDMHMQSYTHHRYNTYLVLEFDSVLPQLIDLDG